MKKLRETAVFKSSIATLLMALMGLFLAYLLVTRAIDTGSWWQYSGALLLVILSIRLSAHSYKLKK